MNCDTVSWLSNKKGKLCTLLKFCFEEKNDDIYLSSDTFSHSQFIRSYFVVTIYAHESSCFTRIDHQHRNLLNIQGNSSRGTEIIQKIQTALLQQYSHVAHDLY